MNEKIRLVVKIKQFLNVKENKTELVMWLAAAIFATISITFVYDLCHTANCSLAFLEGHISDFYDYNVNERGTGAIVYYPTIYILYAIWNIPLKILGGGITEITGNDAWILIWEKGLGILFLTFVYFLMYQIAKQITGNVLWAKNSFIVLWSGIPIFFLFAFSWGLYDTVWLAFLLAGIFCFSKEGGWKQLVTGIVCFAVAVTLKIFVLFLIFPVLCYRVKKVAGLIASAAGVMSLYIVETLAYWHSEYFVEHVLNPMDGGFLVNALFGVSIGRCSVFLVIFIAAGLYEYDLDYEEKNHFQALVIVPFVISAMFAALSQVTPGWSIIYMPFYAILIAGLSKKNRKLFYLANMLLSAGELIYILSTRSFEYGETAFAAGIWGNKIYHTDQAYVAVQKYASEFFTNTLFAEAFQGLLINYGQSMIVGVLLFACFSFCGKSQKKEFCKDFCVIEKEERRFMAITLLVVLSAYLIPVLTGTVQIRRMMLER